MQWGRAVGAAACLAAVVMSGSACGSTIEGTPQAQGDSMVVAGPPDSDSGSPATEPRAPGGAAVQVSKPPTCAEIEKPVLGVLKGYRLDRTPSVDGGSTMCWFNQSGAGGLTKAVTVSVNSVDQTAEQLARTRDYMAKERPDRFVSSPAAERLGGYVSTPLGGRDVALSLPGAQILLIVPDGADVSKEQAVEVVLAVGAAMSN
ncbi:hypothetical protein [Rhodococcus sp. AG1013]|uniref:hypothetical protein n=1 Tax=Rhodococcus sp. AG1013 TaxID=2183996 RepID=UPI0011C05FA1|nr:hypothetical protein [Rhodococcus sp. AG1013]